MRGKTKRQWSGNRGQIEVDFDENGLVVRATFETAEWAIPFGGGVGDWIEVIQTSGQAEILTPSD
jgi:hypothetical protein